LLPEVVWEAFGDRDDVRPIYSRTMPTAAERWSAQLAEWGIPDEIVAQAPVSPWSHDVATFAVDDTLDRDSVSARVAREVLPLCGGVVLDVGCGGGRSSAVLVPPAETLLGVDANETMLTAYADAARSVGVAASTVHGRWPDVAADVPVADVVVCHHVFFNVADAIPFAMALTEHARLAVVVETTVRHPLSAWSAAWRNFWGLERPTGPTHGDLVAVLVEAGLVPEVWHSHRTPLSRQSSDPSTLLPTARRRLCLGPERDGELANYLARNPIEFVDTVATLRWPGTATIPD
jgi:SAM-dependent methyltransferase